MMRRRSDEEDRGRNLLSLCALVSICTCITQPYGDKIATLNIINLKILVLILGLGKG